MVTRRASEGLASASGYHAIESRTLIKLKGGHPHGRKAPRRGDVFHYRHQPDTVWRNGFAQALPGPAAGAASAALALGSPRFVNPAKPPMAPRFMLSTALDGTMIVVPFARKPS